MSHKLCESSKSIQEKEEAAPPIDPNHIQINIQIPFARSNKRRNAILLPQTSKNNNSKVFKELIQPNTSHSITDVQK